MHRAAGRRRALTLAFAAAVGIASVALATGARADALTFAVHQVGQFGGEPSITSDTHGTLYVSTPSGVANPEASSTGASATEPGTWRSLDGGNTWAQIFSPDSGSGDDCVNTNSARILFWCNLDGSVGVEPLQADVWNSDDAYTTTCTNDPGPNPANGTPVPNSCDWKHGNPVMFGTANPNGALCASGGGNATSCSVFGVDRQWVASYIAAGNTAAQGVVMIMYHDFYGPSHIWVNISTDGGQTWVGPSEVLANSTGSTEFPEAEGYTFCNTVPIGDGIAPPGTLDHGRMFVAWIASDPAADAEGCNVTQNEAFHTAWIAYSDNGGSTWTPQLAFDGGEGRDFSTPFASFTLDDRGNPYIAFNSEPPADFSQATTAAEQLVQPETCKSETAAYIATVGSNSALESDPGCNYNTYVVWSSDGGSTWDGGGGSILGPSGLAGITGAAAKAYLVPAPAANGTSQFATIAAGDPGQVDVSYMFTPENEPQGTFADGKFDPLGCAGPGETFTTPTGGSGTTAGYPPRCDWSLVAAQSTSLGSGVSAASWSTDVVTGTTPIHYGDICNLGIACAPVTPDPRHLLDFNMETIDPTTGCAHIAYGDDNLGSSYGDPRNPDTSNGNHIMSADQTSGCLTLTSEPGSGLPEAPLSTLLVGSGAAVAIGAAALARRRRRSAATT